MPRTGPRTALLIPVLWALLATLPARAAVYDPAWTWNTLHTPHFRIHYHLEVEPQAREVAGIAEEVYGPMTEALGWEPDGPTEVTVVDATDLANGYTVVLPYNQIVLYPVRPPLFSTLGDYRQWLRLLFVHEYAHVLGIDPVRGYSAVTRRVFGKVGIPLTPIGALAWFFAAPPNLFLPPWFHEGLAVNLETDFTGAGRKGSTLYRMIYRTDVASGTVPPLDRLGGDFPEWPSYSTRYIYGARLLQLAEDETGPQPLGALARDHSGRFPFTIDAPPRRLTGDDYGGLYRRMVAGLEAEFLPEIAELRSAGLTRTTEITHSGFRTGGPLWLGDQRLAYTRGSPYRPPQLVVQDLTGGHVTNLAERPGSFSRPSPGPGGGLVFPRVEVERPLAGGRYYTDLYRVPTGGGGVDRLTRGARILEADYSATAGGFAAVQVADGQHRLVMLRAGGDREQVLLAEPGVRYGTPRWSPDGSHLAFSRKTDTDRARLALLEPGTGRLQLLTPAGSQAGFPSWSPDGSQIAFSWDRTGVFDLYAYRLRDGTIRRLTRLLGGAFEPDWSPDGSRLAFSSYGPRGYDVAVLALADALDDPVTGTPVEAASVGAPPTAAGPEAPRSALPGEPYRAWPRVLPGFWLPDLLSDNQGVAPGVWTAGHDPLYRHKYYISGFYAGASQRFYGQALYLNDIGYPTVTTQAHKLPWLYAGLFDTSVGEFDYWEENRGAGIEVRLNYPRALSRWSFAVGWAWEEVIRLSRVDEDLGGYQALADAAFQGRLNPLALSVLFDSTFPHSNRFTVGPERGRRLEAVYRLRSELTGAELERQEVLGHWGEYLTLSAEHHWVLALLATGATSWGDATSQSAFQIGGVDTLLPLRGYPARVARGERAAVGTAELRLPAWQLYRGIRDLPLFLSKLHVAAFADTGRTWRGNDEHWRTGAGVELRADTLLGYYLPTTVVFGWAEGFDRDGESQLYFTFRGAY